MNPMALLNLLSHLHAILLLNLKSISNKKIMNISQEIVCSRTKPDTYIFALAEIANKALLHILMMYQ